MNPWRYVFNHIPKSGGTSLLVVCRQNLKDREISPHLHEHHVRLVRPERFEAYRLIAGHFSLLTQAGFSRSRYSMTLLRDPVRTILSTYNFWRNAPKHDPVTAHAKNLSFDEFVIRFENSPAIINNPYTHHFAAIGHDYPGTPDDHELLLKVAKSNLAAFNFVGICEEFGRSIQLLCSELNWRMPAVMPHENQSRPTQTLEQISPETMKRLRARTQVDSELYTYGKELFKERFRRMQQRASFSQEKHGNPHPEQIGEFESHVNRFVPFPLPYSVQREAEIRKVTAEWDQSEQDRTMRITVDYWAGKQMTDLMAGILIHDADGNVVYGTNTMLESVPLEISAGGEGQVRFLLRCDLPSGLYSVTGALAHCWQPGAHYDWIDRATVFQVHAHRAQPSGHVRVHRVESKQSPTRARHIPALAPVTLGLR